VKNSQLPLFSDWLWVHSLLTKLKKKIIQEIKWLTENDWYTRQFNKASALMVYVRIYHLKTVKINFNSKRWKTFLETWKELFKNANLTVDQWGQPVILHNARFEVNRFGES